MADFDFVSLKFENIGEDDDSTYSVFIAMDEEDGPQMIWYDSMGDPIIEVGLSSTETDDINKLVNECRLSKWDGFEETDESAETGFTLEMEDFDGNIIWAQGMGSFPEGYEKFENGLREIFSNYIDG